MAPNTLKKLLVPAACILGLWLGVKYLLPVVLPFIIGALLALTAEPLVSFSQTRLRLPRSLAAGLGVTVALLLLVTLLGLLGALLFRRLMVLAADLPDLGQTAHQGMTVLEDWLLQLAGNAPDSVEPVLTRTVVKTFDSGGALMDRAAARLPGFLTGLLSGVPDGALGVFTGLLSAFMISARLPRLKQSLREKLPPVFLRQYLPALKRTKTVLGGWLRAQGLLALVTYAIVLAGFLLLDIPYSLLIALFIALVDAVPMLGTGLILVPWALVSFLQGRQWEALGLAAITAAATVARSTLEPRLVGRQLGLDPLVTLVALYVGYRLWGLWGLLAAPILTAAVKNLGQTP